MLERTGEHRVEFDYDGEPEFDFAVPGESYAEDLERFPRDEEHTPAWLKEKLATATR